MIASDQNWRDHRASGREKKVECGFITSAQITMDIISRPDNPLM
jgi:hypothetical protein